MRLAEQALALIGQLYDIERDVRALDTEQRRAIRQAKTYRCSPLCTNGWC
ncbi:IS66 family transposase [Pectobacterium actinidiae]